MKHHKQQSRLPDTSHDPTRQPWYIHSAAAEIEHVNSRPIGLYLADRYNGLLY